MPYRLVPSALRETGRTFRDILSHEATGRIDRAQMGLARTKLGYDLQKDQREVFMNTPDTGENIVNKLPISEEQKQQIRNTPQYGVFSKEIFTPKQWVSSLGKVKAEKAKWTHDKKLLDAKQLREDKLLVDERNHEINIAGIKAGAKTDLTPSQEINFNQEVVTFKRDINKEFEEEYPRPFKPEKAKDTLKYNEEMQGWTLAQVTNEYEQMKGYYGDVLGEKAGERINKKAMAAGRKLYRDYSKLKDEAGQEAYLVELRNSSPELYEVLKSLVRGRRSRGATGQW